MTGSLKFPVLAPAKMHITHAQRRKRLSLFLAWLLLVAWLFGHHVFWRDEVRAFSLALSGADLREMLQNVHGEGHPAVWYLILRAAHDVFRTRDVLPITSLVIGIAAMGLFAWKSPFSTFIVALVLFSLFGAFEYVIVARNYGIAALIMFVLAALYPRVKNSLWLGLLLAILANTNVPSAILAAAFLLFRFIEMLTGAQKLTMHEWIVFMANAVLSLVGALICFALIYPPLNDGAVSMNFGHMGLASLAAALVDGGKGFSYLVLNAHGLIPPILLVASCLAFVRKPPALLASLAALLGLKLFFFFVYPSGYRHEALFVVFLLALHWMSASGAVGSCRDQPWTGPVQTVGTAAFVLLLVAQSLDLAKPLLLEAKGVPYSRSADAARLLHRPELQGAIVMADPDLMLEPLVYYVRNPLWFLREESFGKIFLISRRDRQRISLEDILADADRLHRRYGRPIVILLHADLQNSGAGPHASLFRDSTVLTPGGVRHFLASTRLVARLRPAITDESYDFYVYRS